MESRTEPNKNPLQHWNTGTPNAFIKERTLTFHSNLPPKKEPNSNMKFAFAIILTVASAAAFSPSVSRPPSSPRRPLTRRTSGDGTVLNTCFDKSREAFSAEHQHAPIDVSFLQNGMEQFVGELRHNQHSSILFEEEDEDFLLLLEDLLDSDEEDYSVIEIEDIFIDELGNIVDEDSNSKRMLIHARYSEKSSRN